jgi:hypothetical protein
LVGKVYRIQREDKSFQSVRLMRLVGRSRFELAAVGEETSEGNSADPGTEGVSDSTDLRTKSINGVPDNDVRFL